MATKRTVRLLLVEDSAADATAVAYWLESSPAHAFAIRQCMSVNTALQAMQTMSFDVALVDLNLPDSIGVDTVQRIRDAAPDMPFIVLLRTMSSVLTDDELLAAGASDVLHKEEKLDVALPRAILFAVEHQRAKVLDAELKQLRASLRGDDDV